MKNKHQKNGLYYFKKFLPKQFVKKKSDAHFLYLLNNRWDYVIGKKVLDAGCGYCEFLNLNPRGLDVYGVDIKKIKHTKIKYGNLNKKIPYPSNYFDTVTAFHVLEHLKEPEIALQEFRRILKNDGRLVLTVPNLSFKSFFEDYTHVRPYPKPALHNILAANDFEEIRIIKDRHHSKIISALFFFFPKIRWKIEKILGKILPWEITAFAKCSK